MAGIRAADLPDGSVIANEVQAWIKTEAGRWLATGDDMSIHEYEAQEALDDGATVLRTGT